MYGKWEERKIKGWRNPFPKLNCSCCHFWAVYCPEANRLFEAMVALLDDGMDDARRLSHEFGTHVRGGT